MREFPHFFDALSNGHPFLGTAFTGASDQICSAMRLTYRGYKREQLKEYYTEQYNNLADFFEEQNFTVATALLKLITSLKENTWRKDGFTPDFAHEIDQVLPLYTHVLHNKKFQSDIPDITAHYGSLELWFCSILIHDLAEDFNFFPQTVKDMIIDEMPTTPTVEELNTIHTALQFMEVLTHFRKISVEAIEKMTGETINLNTMKKHWLKKTDQMIPLPHLRDHIWPHMDILKDGNHPKNSRFQVYAKWNKKKNEPEVVITRYGKTSMDSDNPSYGAEWNLYWDTVLSFHIYTALAKLGDNINGISTRIAVDQDIKEYQKYMGNRRYISNTLAGVNLMFGTKKHNQNEIIYYPNSPLRKYGRSLGAMAGHLCQISDFYITHHPQLNAEGHKGTHPANIDYYHKEGSTSSLHVSQHMPFGNFAYKYVPQLSHPNFVMMQQLRFAHYDEPNPYMRRLYKTIKYALASEGGEGLERIFTYPEGFQTLEDAALAAIPEKGVQDWLRAHSEPL